MVDLGYEGFVLGRNEKGVDYSLPAHFRLSIFTSWRGLACRIPVFYCL